ncbi:MAG: hypothetical protein RR673_07605 [Erysipelotrichaceae bacterium]
MKFWKYQLNGNDFILIQTKKTPVKEWIIKTCDRYMGIGADGILCINIIKDKLYYHHYNADGSMAKMCGNGIRCVGDWYMKNKKIKQCTIEIQNQVFHLYANQEFVTLIAPIPKILSNNTYQSGVKHKISDSYEENNEYNVDVVHYYNSMYFKVDTYELGVGYTKSCGTGALAAYYHGYLHHNLHSIAFVTSEGGMNIIRKSNHHLYLSGKPVRVYFGYLTNKCEN